MQPKPNIRKQKENVVYRLLLFVHGFILFGVVASAFYRPNNLGFWSDLNDNKTIRDLVFSVRWPACAPEEQRISDCSEYLKSVRLFQRNTRRLAEKSVFVPVLTWKFSAYPVLRAERSFKELRQLPMLPLKGHFIIEVVWSIVCW